MTDKVKTLWGEKTQKELINDYNFLFYFYTWIDCYLRDYIDTNPDEEQLIKERCIEIYEKQYKQFAEQNKKLVDLQVSEDLKKAAMYHSQ